jgi:hypothetical protein
MGAEKCVRMTNVPIKQPKGRNQQRRKAPMMINAFGVREQLDEFRDT